MNANALGKGFASGGFWNSSFIIVVRSKFLFMPQFGLFTHLFICFLFVY